MAYFICNLRGWWAGVVSPIKSTFLSRFLFPLGCLGLTSFSVFSLKCSPGSVFGWNWGLLSTPTPLFSYYLFCRDMFSLFCCGCPWFPLSLSVSGTLDLPTSCWVSSLTRKAKCVAASLWEHPRTPAAVGEQGRSAQACLLPTKSIPSPQRANALPPVSGNFPGLSILKIIKAGSQRDFCGRGESKLVSEEVPCFTPRRIFWKPDYNQMVPWRDETEALLDTGDQHELHKKGKWRDSCFIKQESKRG